jgi:hypothetical protein
MKHSAVRYGAFFLLSLAGFSFGLQRNITVSGVVVDSVTGQPVQNAIVLLYDAQTLNIDTSDLSTLDLDTAFTASNGSFSKTITAPSTNLILIYAVVMEGYSLYYSGRGLSSTTIKLDTIKLVPTDLAAKDTITVSGKVVDSATGIGIPDAIVGLSGGDLDTVGKTAITNANGNFSRQVIINKVGALTIVGYVAYKDGYNPAMGQKTATGKTVDLGNIILSSNTPVLWKAQQQRPLHNIATSMTMYSLNGRKLYTGRVMPLDRAIAHLTSAMLVEFRHNGSIVDRKKVLPAR